MQHKYKIHDTLICIYSFYLFYSIVPNDKFKLLINQNTKILVWFSKTPTFFFKNQVVFLSIINKLRIRLKHKKRETIKKFLSFKLFVIFLRVFVNSVTLPNFVSTKKYKTKLLVFKPFILIEYLHYTILNLGTNILF